jgi:HlyD family secretion protein
MRRIVIALVITALLGLGFYWFSRPKPIPVVLKEVTEGKVEATLANTRAGTIEACQRTKLSTIIGGRIEYLGVKEGDKVKKGPVAAQAVERRPAGASRPVAGADCAGRQT